MTVVLKLQTTGHFERRIAERMSTIRHSFLKYILERDGWAVQNGQYMTIYYPAVALHGVREDNRFIARTVVYSKSADFGTLQVRLVYYKTCPRCKLKVDWLSYEEHRALCRRRMSQEPQWVIR